VWGVNEETSVKAALLVTEICTYFSTAVRHTPAAERYNCFCAVLSSLPCRHC